MSERCDFCWAPLPAESVHRRGRDYCDERCAGRDPQVAADDEPAPLPSPDQLEITSE